MAPFVPDRAYVERLAARADAALGTVADVWKHGTPVELRDRAGLFHTARHVAYCARTTVPEDNDMALYQALVAGLGERYALPAWRTRRTLDRITQWVLNPEHAEYVEKRAKVPAWHGNFVFGSARHEVRLAATEALSERGTAAAEIAYRLECSRRHVRRLITTVGAAREVRPRWSSGEIELLRDSVRERGPTSERQACFAVAKELGRGAQTVHAQWKRMKRKHAGGRADEARDRREQLNRSRAAGR